MIESKIIEIRDVATRIDALAIRMCGGVNAIQNYYFRSSGYPEDGSSIMLMVLYTGKATNDPYEWESLGLGPRTMPVAHNWILDHFSELKDGDVVDVQFILQETPHKKISERESAPLSR
jgi:hypothetical protein